MHKDGASGLKNLDLSGDHTSIDRPLDRQSDTPQLTKNKLLLKI